MKSAIEQEIEWCEARMGESANGIDFEKGFIAGLKQALRFEKAVQQSVYTDKRVCACETRSSEYLKNDVWHCGFCKLPLEGDNHGN